MYFFGDASPQVRHLCPMIVPLAPAAGTHIVVPGSVLVLDLQLGHTGFEEVRLERFCACCWDFVLLPRSFAASVLCWVLGVLVLNLFDWSEFVEIFSEFYTPALPSVEGCVSHSHLLSTSFKLPLGFLCMSVTFGFASLDSHPSSPLNSGCYPNLHLYMSIFASYWKEIIYPIFHQKRCEIRQFWK